ncbi:MAG TPA: hypothetical protein VJQ26_02930 [Ktedonobacteraceae bacterium]|jgi:hypothetical protein|nr:hypothetical protein [Ktedonobacteraceae bacterium]
MSTIATTFPTSRNSLLRLTLIGGFIAGLLHLVVQQGIVFGLILKTPIVSALQFAASGIMGEAAFAGGLATALFGLVLDFIMITIMAGVFVFSVDRIPLLRRNVIVGSILYGFGIFIVMNFIVLPLSAAPALPAPPLWLLIELVLQHNLLIGLPLGILVQRNMR